MKYYVASFVAIIACVEFVASQEKFKCKPRPGCHFSGCDPVADPSAGILDRNEYPMTCEAAASSSGEAEITTKHNFQFLMNITLTVFHRTGDMRKEIENLTKSHDSVNDVIASLLETDSQTKYELDILRSESSQNKKKIKILEQANDDKAEDFKKLASENLKLKEDIKKYIEDNEKILKTLENQLKEIKEAKPQFNIDIKRSGTPSTTMSSTTTEKILPCSRNTCSHNAACENIGISSYRCICKDGYKANGGWCERIQPCDRNPCHAKATCQNIGKIHHVCKCKSGYTGDGFACQRIKPCGLQPCHSQATCQDIDVNKYHCKCNVGYEGNGKICTKTKTFAPTPVVKEAVCNFDQTGNLCEFRNSIDDDFDWTQYQGRTPTENTGPPGGVFKNGVAGGYIYAEADFHARETATLISPRLSLGTYCIRFYIYIYGNSGMGIFRVVKQEHNARGVISTTQLMARSGTTARYWRQERISFTASSPATYVEVHFKATVGRSNRSDIALDEISILPRSC